MNFYFQKTAVKMTCGTVDPPLGNTRLHVTKLLAMLISKHNPQIEVKLSELGTVQVLLVSFIYLLLVIFNALLLI